MPQDGAYLKVGVAAHAFIRLVRPRGLGHHGAAMNVLSDIILPAGRSGIDLALYILLPVTIVMLSAMRLVENWGWLDRLVDVVTPLLRPFGLTGLGIFAALQVNLVGFAAPIATLAMMEQRGASDRHLAAAFAMVLAMSQANASLPMTAFGLHLGATLLFSLAGGLLAAAATTYVSGRHLSTGDHVTDQHPHHQHRSGPKGILEVINGAGAEAFRISIGAIPMLVLSMVAVTALRQYGAITALSRLLAPGMSGLGIDPVLLLPIVTKYLAGGTAMLAVMDNMVRHGQISVALMNASAGFLIHPMDLPGVAILASSGRRVGAVWRPAVAGSLAGIALRTLLHILWG